MTTTSDLRNQVDAKGEEISKIAREIETRVEEYIDWKRIVQEKPLESVGVAVGLGLLFSGSLAPILRGVGAQVGTIARGSLTAYLVSLVARKAEAIKAT